MRNSVDRELEKMSVAREVIRDFDNRAYSAYGSHSFSCGYLGSMLSAAMAKLPKADFDRIVNQLNEYTPSK